MLDDRCNGQLALENANPNDIGEDARTEDALPDDVDGEDAGEIHVDASDLDDDGIT